MLEIRARTSKYKEWVRENRLKATLIGLASITLVSIGLFLVSSGSDAPGTKGGRWDGEVPWDTDGGSGKMRTLVRTPAELSASMRGRRQDSIGLTRKPRDGKLPTVTPYKRRKAGGYGEEGGPLAAKSSRYDGKSKRGAAGQGAEEPSAGEPEEAAAAPGSPAPASKTLTRRGMGARMLASLRAGFSSMRKSAVNAFTGSGAKTGAHYGDKNGEPGFIADGSEVQPGDTSTEGAGSTTTGSIDPGTGGGGGEDGGGGGPGVTPEEPGPEEPEPEGPPDEGGPGETGGGAVEQTAPTGCFYAEDGSRATACTAFRCSQEKSTEHVDEIGGINAGVEGAVQSLLTTVKEEDIQKRAVETLELPSMRKLSSMDYSCYGCDVLDKCVANAREKVSDIMVALDVESQMIDRAVACLNTAPEKRPAGAPPCNTWIEQARKQELEQVVNTALKDHVDTLLTQGSWCASQVPEEYSVESKDPNEEPQVVTNVKGLTAKSEFMSEVESEHAAQSELMTYLEQDWCARHPEGCDMSASLARIRQLRESDDWVGALQTFRGDVPSDIMAGIDATDAHLLKAASKFQPGGTLEDLLQGMEEAGSAVSSYQSTPEKWGPHIEQACSQ